MYPVASVAPHHNMNQCAKKLACPCTRSCACASPCSKGVHAAHDPRVSSGVQWCASEHQCAIQASVRKGAPTNLAGGARTCVCSACCLRTCQPEHHLSALLPQLCNNTAATPYHNTRQPLTSLRASSCSLCILQQLQLQTKTPFYAPATHQPACLLSLLAPCQHLGSFLLCQPLAAICCLIIATLTCCCTNNSSAQTRA